MYAILIFTHSLFRWLVLVSLLFAIYRAYRGWLADKTFTPFEDTIRNFATAVINIQFLIGLWLYFKSPVVGTFWSNFSTAIHERELRFFGMEHVTMMFVAVSIINTSAQVVKKRSNDKAKFKTVAIWLTIGFIIIFFSIPWGFSPFTTRPYLRTF